MDSFHKLGLKLRHYTNYPKIEFEFGFPKLTENYIKSFQMKQCIPYTITHLYVIVKLMQGFLVHCDRGDLEDNGSSLIKNENERTEIRTGFAFLLCFRHSNKVKETYFFWSTVNDMRVLAGPKQLHTLFFGFSGLLRNDIYKLQNLLSSTMKIIDSKSFKCLSNALSPRPSWAYALNDLGKLAPLLPVDLAHFFRPARLQHRAVKLVSASTLCCSLRTIFTYLWLRAVAGGSAIGVAACEWCAAVARSLLATLVVLRSRGGRGAWSWPGESSLDKSTGLIFSWVYLEWCSLTGVRSRLASLFMFLDSIERVGRRRHRRTSGACGHGVCLGGGYSGCLNERVLLQRHQKWPALNVLFECLQKVIHVDVNDAVACLTAQLNFADGRVRVTLGLVLLAQLDHFDKENFFVHHFDKVFARLSTQTQPFVSNGLALRLNDQLMNVFVYVERAEEALDRKVEEFLVGVSQIGVFVEDFVEAEVQKSDLDLGRVGRASVKDARSVPAVLVQGGHVVVRPHTLGRLPKTHMQIKVLEHLVKFSLVVLAVNNLEPKSAALVYHVVYATLELGVFVQTLGIYVEQMVDFERAVRFGRRLDVLVVCAGWLVCAVQIFQRVHERFESGRLGLSGHYCCLRRAGRWMRVVVVVD
ncbi:hypothetical protein BpHYR1_021831 [Brachionus plicatilis]|uniref:Uncharacterized protein n=1 Tax=Brachionus plicatilis TaxID=10195 RepID=A0A3M7T3X3_BRAPC|nr:hypothetical protein BpHYR1_021831 [Brachionus plicatilis]